MESNNTAGANHGKFYVDLVRAWKVSDLPVNYDENSSENLILPRAYNNKVVLNKTFTNGEWQFVCFPFSLNAADIETIFGKGTEIEILEPIGIYGGNEEGQKTQYEPQPKYMPVNVIEAGFPYRIRPTDALTSPIILEHVRITEDTPKDGWTQDAYYTFDGNHPYFFIVGTFQKTDEVPAFSAILTYTDPTRIESLLERKDENNVWYDLNGRLEPSPTKGNIYVTKGMTIYK